MKVEIEPDGITARELNPLGEEPDTRAYVTSAARTIYNGLLSDWQQAEQTRKVYEIEEDRDYKIGDSISTNSLGIIKIGNEAEIRGAKSHAHIRKAYEPGTIHECELLSNGKIRITD